MTQSEHIPRLELVEHAAVVVLRRLGGAQRARAAMMSSYPCKLYCANGLQPSTLLHICLLMTRYSCHLQSQATELGSSATPATNVYSAL